MDEEYYDEQGRILIKICSDGERCEWTYYSNGAVSSFKRYYSETNFMIYTCDINGSLLSSENAEGYTVEYTNDENGNRTSSKDSNGEWSKMTYDRNGRLSSYRDSNGGSIEYM